LVNLPATEYSLTEAANKCQVHRSTLWRWIKNKKIKSYKNLSGQYRIKAKDLQTFIEKTLDTYNTDDDPDRRTILIVDDDTRFRRFAIRALSRLEVDVDEASNGFEAAVKMAANEPNLIVLDLYMPNTDGFEVCKTVKSDPTKAHIKVLAISGKATPAVEKRIRGLGADEFMSKPISKNDLIKRIQLLLDGN